VDTCVLILNQAYEQSLGDFLLIGNSRSQDSGEGAGETITCARAFHSRGKKETERACVTTRRARSAPGSYGEVNKERGGAVSGW